MSTFSISRAFHSRGTGFSLTRSQLTPSVTLSLPLGVTWGQLLTIECWESHGEEEEEKKLNWFYGVRKQFESLIQITSQRNVSHETHQVDNKRGIKTRSSCNLLPFNRRPDTYHPNSPSPSHLTTPWDILRVQSPLISLFQEPSSDSLNNHEYLMVT